MTKDTIPHALAEISLDPAEYPTLTVVGPLLERAMSELAEPFPSAEEALRWAIDEAVRRLANSDPIIGTAESTGTLSRMFDLLVRRHRLAGAHEELGADLELSELAAIAFDLRHSPSPDPRPLLAKAQSLAAEWIK